jgi:hypothetical protein
LTLLVSMLLLPWAWKQISEWLPASATRSIGPAAAPLPELVPPVTSELEATTPTYAVVQLAGLGPGTWPASSAG